MKALIVFICTILITPNFALAHRGHSWKTDRKAFKSVKHLKNLPRNSTRKFSQSIRTASTELKEIVAAILSKAQERKSEKGRDAIRHYLQQEFTALGFKTSEHKYASGTNFIAEKAGSDPSKVLILSAHMDSVGNAGANDDAIGVAGTLVVAKRLSTMKLGYTLRVVGFDEEESEYKGSTSYVNSLSNAQKETIIADMQLEMMGYNHRKDGVIHVIDCEHPDSMFITELMLKSIQSLKLPLSINEACTDRSDHSAFWMAKLPAVVISENFFGSDGDPCYHESCDVLDDRLDFDYAARITDAVTLTVKTILKAN